MAAHEIFHHTCANDIYFQKGDISVLNKLSILLIIAAIALSLIPLTSTPVQAQNKIKIAFVPGVVDPFYQTMQKGIEQAASDLGVTVVTQVPEKFDPTVQTPIIKALTADKSVNALITAA